MAAEASGGEHVVNLAAEFNLLPRIFDIVQSLQRASDPQETTKKVITPKRTLLHSLVSASRTVQKFWSALGLLENLSASAG